VLQKKKKTEHYLTQTSLSQTSIWLCAIHYALQHASSEQHQTQADRRRYRGLVWFIGV